jgi:cellulose synthase/poly-beta-1,6-N-acetylglucosamine synthase-like glycosyltransferase
MISIIVPVYNGEKTINKCLCGIKNQDYNGETEIIVVDDGSTDSTIEAIKRCDGVNIITQLHRGPATARNLGAKKANGNIVLFTDADCIPDKSWVSEMIKPFAQNEIVGVQGAYRTVQPSIVAKFVQLEIEDRYGRMKTGEYIDFIGSYSAAYKKDVFLSFGGFNESFLTASGEDTELSYRLSKNGYKMVFNPSAVVCHTHPDTMRKYLNQKFYRAYWRVLLYKKHKSKMVKDTYTPQTLKVQMFLVYLLILSIIYSFISYYGVIATTATILLFLLTTIKLSAKNFIKCRTAGVITPPMIFLRACAFSAGSVFGTLNLLRRKYENTPRM